MADALDRHYKALHKARSAGDAEAVDIIRQRIGAEMQAQQKAAATEGMSTTDKVVAGIGQGMVNTARNVGDIVGRVPGLGFMRPDQKSWAEEKDASAPLLDTTPGFVGSMLGEAVATLPIGGGAGAGAKALGTGAVKAVAPRLAKALAGKMGQAMAAGSATGYVMGGPENRGTGAALGAALPLALGKVGAGVRRVYQGVVKPTDAAKALAREGVELTVGQSAPESLVGQMEELASDLPVLRQAINARRGAAKGQWQNLVLGESVAPGAAKLNPAAAIDDRLAAAYDTFAAAYAPFKEEMVYPAIHNAGKGVSLFSTKNKPGALAQAVADRGILADDRTRRMVGDWLENQLTVLPKPKGAAGKISADYLLTVRSNIRKEIAKLPEGNAQRRLLENAEEAMTGALESQLPADAAKGLRAVDAAYAKHKVVSDTVGRAGDSPQGFTAAQLSKAVQAAADDGAYARGGGGRLRELAKQGREVFESSIPKTGARMLPLALSAPVTIPLSALAATKTGARLLTGTAKSQMALQEAERKLLEKLLNAGSSEALDHGARGAGTLLTTGRD